MKYHTFGTHATLVSCKVTRTHHNNFLKNFSTCQLALAHLVKRFLEQLKTNKYPDTFV